MAPPGCSEGDLRQAVNNVLRTDLSRLEPFTLLQRFFAAAPRQEDLSGGGEPGSGDKLSAPIPAATDTSSDANVDAVKWEIRSEAPRARKAVSKGQLVLVLILLLTSAAAIKLGTMIRRSREFHPNWPSKGLAKRGLRISGD